MSIPWLCPSCWWLCICSCVKAWLTISGPDNNNPCTRIRMTSIKTRLITVRLSLIKLVRQNYPFQCFFLLFKGTCQSNKGTEFKNSSHTCKRSTACHAMPPPVAKSIQEIPRAPRVSNLPCPEMEWEKIIITRVTTMPFVYLHQ